VSEYDIPSTAVNGSTASAASPDPQVVWTRSRCSAGRPIEPKMFIDATYEGDLMAAAGVQYHVGREASSTYDEKWNGVQVGVLHHRHHFGAVRTPIDPYVVSGIRRADCCRASAPIPPGRYGEADRKVQAYCFRMCLTDESKEREPFARPRDTTHGNTNSCCGSSWEGGARRSTSSTPSRTTRPTRTITVPSAPTTSATTHFTRQACCFLI